MSDFRFKVGDLVIMKVAVADCMKQCESGSYSQPLHFMVLERLTQECPGGAQRHYTLSNGVSQHRVNEIEVAAPSEFDLAAAVAAFQRVKEEHARKEREESDAYYEARLEARQAARGEAKGSQPTPPV